ADGARRRLGRVGRTKHVADFANRAYAFIDQRDALLRAGFVLLTRRTFRGGAARHEPDDVLELVVAKERAKDGAKLLLLLAADLKSHLLFNGCFGFRGDDILELRSQGLANRAVKLHRLRYAHAVHFYGDDVQARAGEEINHVA